jgi:hypothetical protein
MVKRGVEHSDLRQIGPGGADRFDVGQIRQVVQWGLMVSYVDRVEGDSSGVDSADHPRFA